MTEPVKERDYHSHSSFDAFRSCPKKYELRYIKRVDQVPMLAGVGGNAVHRATEIIDKEGLWSES